MRLARVYLRYICGFYVILALVMLVCDKAVKGFTLKACLADLHKILLHLI